MSVQRVLFQEFENAYKEDVVEKTITELCEKITNVNVNGGVNPAFKHSIAVLCSLMMIPLTNDEYISN